jgi:ABC-type phosphate transport system substrate-binding protein
MDETERELYFLKKKDELNERISTQRYERTKKEQDFNQVVQRVDSIRQAFGVSEEQFVEAADELEELLKDTPEIGDITEQDVVEYASLKPHISVVRDLVKPFEDNIAEEKYGEVVEQLASYLRDGKADKKTIQDLLKRNFSVEEDVKELNTRVYSKQKSKPAKKVIESSDKYETFDDWE